MKLNEIKKLKRGTPIKVVYRKFPYVMKYHSQYWNEAGTAPTAQNTVVTCQVAGEYIEVKATYVMAIDGLTEFKS